MNELILNGADRELIKEIMSYTSSSIGKNIKNLEKVLEIKKYGKGYNKFKKSTDYILYKCMRGCSILSFWKLT